MAKKPHKPKPEKIETEPGAWGRFEQAVDAAVASGPMHRKSPKPHKLEKARGAKKTPQPRSSQK